MTVEERHRLLLDRALRANRVEQAVKKVRAIVGPSDIPESEEKAQAAFDKLHNGETPDPLELAALEIVIRLLRPVVYTRANGVLDGLPDDAGHNLYTEELKDLWSAFQAKAKTASRSVGRVERDGHHVGTGFLTGEGLLATNRHVLAALTYGTEVIPQGVVRVCFKNERDEINEPEDFVAVEGVRAIHPRLDMVLLALAAHSRSPLEMAAEALVQGDRIVVIGYPGQDRENNPLFLTSVFGNGFGMRRVALGEVLDGTDNPNMFHDASTTRGNSGSPIFSLATGQVAGIHRGGFFMYRNEAIDRTELAAFVAAPGS